MTWTIPKQNLNVDRRMVTIAVLMAVLLFLNIRLLRYVGVPKAMIWGLTVTEQTYNLGVVTYGYPPIGFVFAAIASIVQTHYLGQVLEDNE